MTAVAYDATGGPGYTNQGVFGTSANVSYNHTVAGGANCLLCVDVAVLVGPGSSGQTNTPSVTYSGSPLSFVGSCSNYDGNGFYAYVFALRGPAAGTASVQVAVTATATSKYYVTAAGVSYVNCGGVGTVVANSDNSATTDPSLTVSGATSSEMVHVAFATDATTSSDDMTGLSGGTTRYNFLSGGTVPILVGDVAGGSTANFSTSISGGYTEPWGGVGYILLNAETSATGTFTGHGALTAAALLLALAALTGHGALSATTHAKFTETAALSGHSVLTATANATKFVFTAAPAGHGVLSATVYATSIQAETPPPGRTATVPGFSRAATIHSDRIATIHGGDRTATIHGGDRTATA